jgi:hypothetical protein
MRFFLAPAIWPLGWSYAQHRAYLRLAEAYEHQGDEASARENGKKTLDLNPDIIGGEPLRKREEP